MRKYKKVLIQVLIASFVKALSRRIFELYRSYRNQILLKAQQKSLLQAKSDLALKMAQLHEYQSKFDTVKGDNSELGNKIDALKSQLRVERQVCYT